MKNYKLTKTEQEFILTDSNGNVHFFTLLIEVEKYLIEVENLNKKQVNKFLYED